jgi:hypothetical protein
VELANRCGNAIYTFTNGDFGGDEYDRMDNCNSVIGNDWDAAKSVKDFTQRQDGSNLPID